MSRINFMVFAIGVLAISCVQPLNIDEKTKILDFVLPFITECSKDHPFTQDSIKAVFETGKFSSLDKCFLGCILKKVGMLDDQGLFNEATTNQLAKDYLSAEDQKIVPETISACLPTNEKPVSDGNKGCERSGLLLECGSTFIDTLFATS